MASSKEEHEKMSLHRLMSYSDAVFAIVLTILILEISVPVIREASSTGEMLSALKEMMPKILAFLLSFFIVSSWWTGYYQQLAYFRKIDLVILWANNGLLLCICVMPFLTAMIGEYPHNAVGVFLFGITQALAGVFVGIISKRALAKGCMNLNIDLELVTKLTRYHWVTPLLFTIFASIAFINTFVSLSIFFIMFLFWTIKAKDMVKFKETEENPKEPEIGDAVLQNG